MGCQQIQQGRSEIRMIAYSCVIKVRVEIYYRRNPIEPVYFFSKSNFNLIISMKICSRFFVCLDVTLSTHD